MNSANNILLANKIDVSVISWSWSRFSHLNVDIIQDVFKLRQDVFIVEQGVPYSDIDGNDAVSMHLTGYIDKQLVAYMRVLPLHIFAEGFYSFGRVITHQLVRGTGIGQALVERGIQYLDDVRDNHPVKISSQLYLQDFYRKFGFRAVGSPYIEDRIMHVAMIRA